MKHQIKVQSFDEKVFWQFSFQFANFYNDVITYFFIPYAWNHKPHFLYTFNSLFEGQFNNLMFCFLKF